MLQSLRIQNFALIEDLEMICGQGLNVLTGETGAGKSILIDALNILLGEKAGPGFIRTGAEKAVIEGVFAIKPNVIVWLKEKELIDEASISDNISNDTNKELLLSREITKTGSRFRINGILTNQACLNELKQELIHVHAQHEARTLLSAQSQLNIIDSLADAAHNQALAQMQIFYAKKMSLVKELTQIQTSEEERLKNLDFARFQYDELQAANLIDTDEDEQLNKKQIVLSNVAQLDLGANSAYQVLVGADASAGVNDQANTGAIDAVQKALGDLERASKLDDNLHPVMDNLNHALALLEDAQIGLRRYKDNLETDPQALQEIETRVAQLAVIKRKYGPTLAQAIERGQTLALAIDKLENAAEHAHKIEKELEITNKELEKFALAASKTRQALAQKLVSKMKKELAELGMERCQFEVAFEKLSDISATGFDHLEFMIAPNPGQAILPLAKIASGGELSRIMLALKSIVANVDDPPTVIFDEIDSGLSGRIVQAVRDKLVKLAQLRQILCITHQPIIAAAAHNHLFIEKQHGKETTNVTMKALQGQERVKALAAMASGNDNEAVALEFAQALINQQAMTQ